MAREYKANLSLRVIKIAFEDFKFMQLIYDRMQEKKVKSMEFTGIWHIYEMETWDEDYFNTEVQAYIKIEPNNRGCFQFGLVSGDIDGKVVDYADGKRFEFTWEGNDECDPASGSGWVRIKEKDILEGEFRIHNGDDSTFLAKRAE